MNSWLWIPICILGGFASVSFADDDDFKAVPVSEVVATVVSIPVVEKNIHQSIIAYGTLLPDADQITTLSMPHAGMVENVWVRPGQKVSKGDALFSLNASPGAKMNYLQAKASVQYTEKNLEREQKLLSQHLTTKAQVTIAKKALQDAKINLASLKTQGLGETLQRFLAPQDGIVIQVDVQAGQRVQSDSSALQIASNQRFVVHLGIEPEDLPKLKVGQVVKLGSVFDVGQAFRSQVAQIHAMLNPTTHLVDVIVPIPSANASHFVIGSRLKGEVELLPHQAMIVPRSAVLEDENGSFVYLNQQSIAKKVGVSTGESTHQWIEITKGLTVGEKVITQGNYELEPGMKVREESTP